MYKVAFDFKAFEDFNNWANEDKKTYNKIVGLIKEISRTPFQGTGKPEPLKHNLSGYWSRRIDQQHRLVYKVAAEEIIIIACRYHYD